MHALVGGVPPIYEKMYDYAMRASIQNNVFRPMVTKEEDILMSSAAWMWTEDHGESIASLGPHGQHLVCFAGGMLALGG
jgi:mannosyl-oligosaccharide alpha-1,2-mannosidase